MVTRAQGKRRVQALVKAGRLRPAEADIALAEVLAGRDPIAKVTVTAAKAAQRSAEPDHELFMASVYPGAAKRLSGRRVAAGAAPRAAVERLSELAHAAPAQVLGG